MTKLSQLLSAVLLNGLLLSSSALAMDNTVTGQWQTTDRFGQPESLVELFMEGDELRGRIVKLYDDTNQNAVCTECSDDREGQPIVGLVFITGLEADGEKWINGQVLDPESGSEYDCEVWREGNTLKLKAGFGVFSQTKVWNRL
ncbi:DUF2147 domain-containing protein [Pseudomaricurvus alkylphenolicus]|jgi:uncharacterized protein (DUF2147 family)|uniref:DUF2147 domain-containing protein n=1 Tax=Pseudomaricurvus alkylphenolicus TaxID=1306991 RepID=UPI00141F2E0B|nr:DUF2147 domain-containing protein [Pseudomaricurvus alkylphenolicus]NIB42693.1 DUF2147 domain-containing protein [Pseudomaricurvus alkylphenolicus]